MSAAVSGEQLRADAAALRRHADEMVDALARLRLYDRPDVWRGRRADRFRLDLAAQHRQLLGSVGAVPLLLDLASHLEGRASFAPTVEDLPAWFTPPAD
jgi:hypothetical protein